MDMNKIRPASDAAWYCRKDAEEERFYEIFFQLCRKYSVRWASATPKEKSFIEEVTRVTYEREMAKRNMTAKPVRGFFDAEVSA